MSLKGLTSAEVEARKASGQVNEDRTKSDNTYLAIFARNAITPFNTVLIILGVALLICNDPISALAATAVIFVNIMISTIQEWKAKRRLDKISVLLRPRATVLRDDKEQEIDFADIVLGDVIHLRTGEQAQVDGEVLESRLAEMDESLLTGESKTIRKGAGDIVYSGSSCVAGECYFRADKVGQDTFSEKITAAARKFEKKITPVQKETSAVTKTLMIVAFIFLGISIVLNLVRGIFSIDGTLRETVIILDMVPIALFLLISLMYMIAAVRMADSGVLLQNSGAVESMSHVDTVCMDKTGTITTNKLLYEDVHYFGDQEKAERMIREFCYATGSKNRTLGAVESHFGSSECALSEEVQFSSGRKFSAIRTAGENPESVIMGAWNVLRPNCEDPSEVDGVIEAYASRGLRTIVLCDGGNASLYEGDEAVLPPLSPVAVVAIRDEVRADCQEIIRDFTDHGMDVKVISGDDPDTVNALFDLAGIPGERNLLSGDDLDNLSDEEYDEKVLRTNIFGRMRPEQKEDVVESLRRSGRYVAMVGDGVNDVRSIKKANVGIAMESGSGAARGVADMVLVDDNFRALPKAIIEGQRTVSGLRDILRLYLNRNFTIAILVFIMLIIFGTAPMLPVQNAFYGTLTVSIAAILLTFWAKPSEDRSMLLPRIIRYCVPITLCSVAGSFIVYLAVYYSCQTGVINTTDIVMGMVDIINSMDFDALKSYKEQYGSFGGMYDLLTGGGAMSLDLVIGKNAMLYFLIFTGIIQLMVLFPPLKILSWDTEYRRAAFPLLIMGLAALLFALVYWGVPWLAILMSMVIFPPDIIGLLVVATVVWYFGVIALLRSKSMVRIDKWSDMVTKSVLKDRDLSPKRIRRKKIQKDE